MNASVLKVKLALSIIGISSIHLLKSFINAGSYEVQVLMWQTIIHVVFLIIALAIAYTDRLTSSSHHRRPQAPHTLHAGAFSCAQARLFSQKLTSYRNWDRIAFKRFDINRIQLLFLKFRLLHRCEIRG